MIKRSLQKMWQLCHEQRIHIYWCLGLGGLLICLLNTYLVSDAAVLSKEGTDVSSYFYYSYSLALDGLSQGDLVKWNPYAYGGQPFLGSFQSALLYPVTWLVSILPVAMALNWIVFLHLWLLGIGMYGWSVYRGVRPMAAFIAGLAIMFGGQFFTHIFAGHIPNLCSMAWTPFIFWGIDGWLRQRHLGWIFMAAAAAALQIYAGHPQYFYYTAIIAGLYSLVFLFDTKQKKSAIIGLLAIYPLAMLLAAAQLLPGLSTASESVRTGGVGREFTEMFGLPWENFFTLVSPWFFGNMNEIPYWGKCYLWEMQLYCGVGILLLAVFAWFAVSRRLKIQYAILLVTIALLAVGSRTPLYDLLYNCLPGYSMFRGTSKFAFLGMMLIVLMGGHGLSLLSGGRKPHLLFGTIMLVLGVILAIVGFSLKGDMSTWFSGLLQDLSSSTESYVPHGMFAKDAAVLDVQKFSSSALLWSSVWFFVFGGFFLLLRQWKEAIWGVVAMVVLDSILFTVPLLKGTDVETMAYPQLAEMLKKNPGDYRTLNLLNPEANVKLRSEGLWGYDPFVLKRYAEFMFFTQGYDPDAASQNLNFRDASPLFAMLRGRAAFVPSEKGIEVKPFDVPPFNRFYLVTQYQVIHGQDEKSIRNAIFQKLSDNTFDPKKEVILEEDPLLPPDAGDAQYQIRLLNASTDHWTVEVATTRSSILVMTDAYSKDWRVTAFPDSVQTNYHVLPANYMLRAIPLAPGRHLIRIEYVPSGFYNGLLISGLAWLLVAAFLSVPVMRDKLGYFELAESE